MRRFALPVLALLTFSVAVGCADPAGDDEASASADAVSAAKTITKDDAGKTIDVKKGQPFKVVLSSNPTTGYAWKVVSTNRSLGYPSPMEGTFEGPGSNGPVGSGGRQTFTWQTKGQWLQAGSIHHVKMEYRRSFEPEAVAAAEAFEFDIRLTDGATPAEPEPLIITESQSGAQLQATEGQPITVRLSENASTGYRWYVVGDGALTAPASTIEGVTDRPGASATRVLTWKTAGKPGRHTIRLKSSRGASGTAAKTFRVTVTVGAAAQAPAFECPTVNIVNCMPPTTSPYCASDYRSWASENCDVSYLD